jgi:hypothetical protein
LEDEVITGIKPYTYQASHGGGAAGFAFTTNIGQIVTVGVLKLKHIWAGDDFMIPSNVLIAGLNFDF